MTTVVEADEGPNRHSIPMVTLSFVSMNIAPLMRCYYTAKLMALRGWRNLVAEGSPAVRESDLEMCAENA